MTTKTKTLATESGKVKFFNIVKGFGFITGTDGKDYFFHFTGMIDKVTSNDEVTFNLEEGDKGLKAINIRKNGK
jgi:cold shock protein